MFYSDFGISPELVELAGEMEEKIRVPEKRILDNARFNFLKVLHAMQQETVTDVHLKGSTGYGYGDLGRDRLDDIFARVFRAESGLVRLQIVSGTHAIALGLFGNLRPGDELLGATGRPYDTLEQVIGVNENISGSLKDFGIKYNQVELTPDGKPNLEELAKKVTKKTRMVFIQRSRGYQWRPSLLIEEIKKIVEIVKNKNPRTICFVDNCYGEFVERQEPIEVGADLAAGSLIKNPGGGLAPCGGYLVGRQELVESAAERLTAPGIGAEVGASLEVNRLFYHGLYLAPQMVAEALNGAVFAAALFSELGFGVSPGVQDFRTDIIQAVLLGTAERLIAFCQGIQQAAAVDMHVRPEPWGMPGYQDAVIMAAGGFIQGSSIELSADGPLRPPYVAYLQGGLNQEQVRLAALKAAKELIDRGLVKIEKK